MGAGRLDIKSYPKLRIYKYSFNKTKQTSTKLMSWIPRYFTNKPAKYIRPQPPIDWKTAKSSLKNIWTEASRLQQQYGRQAVAAANLSNDLYQGQYASAAYRAATFPRKGYTYKSWNRRPYRTKYQRFKPSRAYIYRKRYRSRAQAYLRKYKYKRNRRPYIRKNKRSYYRHYTT